MVDVTAGASGVTGREFRIGKVISKSFSIFAAHFGTFSLVAGVVWLPIALYGYFSQSADPNAQGLQALISFVAILFLQPLSTAIILYGAFQHMRGRPVRLGESISRGLARFLPLVGVMLLALLGIMLGALLFIIPGLILLVMWYVAVPACVVERIGPIASLRRSRILTKGHRWKLFGLYVLVALISGIVGGLLPIAGRAVGGPVGVLLAQWVWQAVAQAFSSVLIVVAYYDLRVAKEGIDIERIAVVFD
ncbi:MULTISPECIES: hypothetical protein [Rhodomicrobium]|uniref:hypothetical protein n=1 Tax=Rhodomicrobium TaxID=1068 RepID=UPI000B4C1855|nr:MULTISPECIES: hypothetical protein [Rhodomicrobium]